MSTPLIAGRLPCQMRGGVLFNPLAWWVGVHYSSYNRRFCINLLPMFTAWVALPGGKEP
jgi:hypothetical protein